MRTSRQGFVYVPGLYDVLYAMRLSEEHVGVEILKELNSSATQRRKNSQKRLL